MGNQALEQEKLGSKKFTPKARNFCGGKIRAITLGEVCRDGNKFFDSFDNKPETPYEKMNRKRENAKNNVLDNRKENVGVDDVNDERDLQRESEERYDQARSDEYNDNMYNNNI